MTITELVQQHGLKIQIKKLDAHKKYSARIVMALPPSSVIDRLSFVLEDADGKEELWPGESKEWVLDI